MITRTKYSEYYSGLETLTTYYMNVFDADLNLVFTLNTNIRLLYVYFSFQHVFKMKFISMLHLPKYFQLKIYHTKQHGIIIEIRVL